MLILGIETSTEQVACAIGGHEGVLALFESQRGKRHAETITPAIKFVCEQARVELSEISVVAVDVGPGLYTGLRVGIATAKAIAGALRVPMIGVPSLDLLALPLRFTSRQILAVIDARRGEVFHASYRSVPAGVQRISEYEVSRPEDLASELEARNQEALVVGDGALRYRSCFEAVRRVELTEQWLAHPSAAPLVQLAHAHALREEWTAPSEIHPLYLRKPDAEINWKTRDHP